MKKLSTTVILLLVAYSVFSQISIKGRVLTEDGKPIPYANISVNDRVGAMANNLGMFNIETSVDGEDSLRVSCIGYESTLVKIETEKQYTIFLTPTSYQFDAVAVSPVNAEKLVKEAEQKIKDNYSKNVRFYGQYGQVSFLNEEYQGIFRADVYASINEFNKKRPSEIETEVVGYEFYLSDTLRSFISEEALLKAMCPAYRHVVVLRSAYEFAYEGKFMFADKEIIKVSFKPKRIDPKRTQMEGYMYIDSVTKGFLYFDYSLVSAEEDFVTYNNKKQRRTGYNAKISYAESMDVLLVNYAIITHTDEIMLKDGSVDKAHSIFNFFSKDEMVHQLQNNVLLPSVSEVLRESEGKMFSESDYEINSYIIESDEALDFKRQIKK